LELETSMWQERMINRFCIFHLILLWNRLATNSDNNFETCRICIKTLDIIRESLSLNRQQKIELPYIHQRIDNTIEMTNDVSTNAVNSLRLRLHVRVVNYTHLIHPSDWPKWRVLWRFLYSRLCETKYQTYGLSIRQFLR